MKAIKGIIAVILVLAIILLAYALWPTKTASLSPLPADNSPQMASLISQGQYLATAGDCAACHTQPGGKTLAGGLPIHSPIGVIYTTNITPDKQTGIGNYSLDDFERAVRHGILPNGDTLYPAMPYPSYSKISDDDVRALYAWFMHGVKPVSQQNRASDIPWPLSMRLPLAVWRKMFAPDPADTGFTADKYQSASLARGAYLVQGLGHCGTCHTPRASTLQEKALDDSGKQYLAGGQVIDGWLAVNLRGDKADGLGNWTEQDIIDTLRTGHNTRHTVVGQPMAEVVAKSTSKMSDADLAAIAAYIKSLPAGQESKSSYTESSQTADMLARGENPTPGAQLYVDNCSACHQTSGKGVKNVFPAMADNPTVLADNPVSVIHLILDGSRLPATPEAPSALAMPGFGWRLSDKQVADLSNFIRNSWGNKAPEVTEQQVKQVRADYPPKGENKDP
ncbi:alcohol dehydrogenase [Tatumella morbirosei]|uniref:Alcohol dehydrogenase n=1 Tax=Tatumella morbirosei TaxID=642227 RepID=A0A0F5BVI8_9GAMM|nr:cytochrome c [Tatumella morbirosei]KKA63579.1 alcohol dehydrogenase [Tatumella morbirosei]